MIATAQTAHRNHRLKHKMLQNEPPKSLTSRLFSPYGTTALPLPRRRMQITLRLGHVDNPAVRVKFRRSNSAAAAICMRGGKKNWLVKES